MLRVFKELPRILCILCTLGCCQADTIYWTNGNGGSFSAPANWSPNVVPVAVDTLLFTNSATYTFTVDGGATYSSAVFNQGVVAAAINGGTWLVTNVWNVGELAG